MARRVDLKSVPVDSLRMILGEATTTHTRPFGQKAASAGEGINYGTSTGQVLRWDGDAVADYDARISEAKQLVVEATDGLNKAGQELEDARERIGAVEAGTTPEAIGSTAADQINSNKLLVGRDAILTGTLDVAQLNVTEEMAAEVVRAMSTETKQLVVTEDAILNRVTVIQDIVTPQLVAERINVQDLGARLVTAGAIQTDADLNRGIKINDGGIEGFDTNSRQTIRINGSDNLIIGNLATAPQNQTGVKITSRGSLAAMDLYSDITPGSDYAPHGGIWFDSPTDNIFNTAMHMAATTKTSVAADDPGIHLLPIAKTISFTGKFTRDSAAMKSGQLEAANISGGGYSDWVVTFPNSMTPGSNVAVFVSPVATNLTEFAYVLKNVGTGGFTLRLVNKSTNASGYCWIKWTAIAI
ncbi:hypothetical protein [Kocuria sp. TGY1127_2]|uniref:hypothetical protein n=1 Tax=Kocuria sp. TGY1127_2 TaxID=2711328 RepID=UPI0015B999A2|nr:hypothetical protein [Kocuria sp. TGY1127_2]